MSYDNPTLETYDPDDKSFTKRIIRPGKGDVYPNHGSTCVVNMSQIVPDSKHFRCCRI